MPLPGVESGTAGFEVHILGEELFCLLGCIHRQYVSFFVPFSPPVGIEPQSNGLTAPRFLKMGILY